MDIKIAALDNDRDTLELIEDTFKKWSFVGTFSTSMNDLINSIEDDPTIIITDFYLDEGTGIDVMNRVTEVHSLCTFIFMSARMSERQLLDIINVGWGCYYVKKDFEGEFLVELMKTVERAKASMKSKIEAFKRAKQRHDDLQEQAIKMLKFLDGN